MKHAALVIFRSLVLLLAGIAIGLYMADQSGHGLGFSLAHRDKVSKVLDLVRNTYVDSVNVDSIEGVAVNNVLQNLDPHSLYLPAQQASSINERLAGEYTGVGVEYLLLRDTLVITHIVPNGPADKAGLLAGDKIIELDHKHFSGIHLTNQAVNKAFRGPRDSQLLISVQRAQQKDLKFLNITRGHVDASSLDAAYITAPQTGYIKISKFATTTDADFRVALAKLKIEGMQKLILDLRGNGGGYLNTATALADEFLPKGKLIVYTKGTHEPRTDYFSTDSGNFEHGKLAVLIDENSASASEILSGALQDLDRAVIIGRRSYGKGLVQEQFPFADGSAVNLTVARYYTPSGRSIQKSYKNGLDSYRNELAERVKRGELISEQSYRSDSLFKSPSQFHTATGRKVFSGGGIMPDIFVPADTAQNTYTIDEIANNQLFTAYVVDKMQPLLSRYNNEDSFLERYTISDEQLDDFVTYCSRTLKEMDSNDIRLSKPYMKTLLKAFAANFKWGDNAYFRALNANDETIKRAVTALD